MKLKLISNIRNAWLITLKNAIQQKVMILAIPGVYQREWEEDINKIIERITIRQISTVAELYNVKKTILTRSNLDEKVSHKHKIDEWMATYDCSRRQLHEVAGQRQCSFISEELIVFVDEIGYTKVKIIHNSSDKK
ncbi:MAG: hypothetical protein ABI688_04220 [Bacteroidota bacterium]